MTQADTSQRFILFPNGSDILPHLSSDQQVSIAGFLLVSAQCSVCTDINSALISITTIIIPAQSINNLKTSIEIQNAINHGWE